METIDCIHCHKSHSYSSEECFEKLFIIPEILFISASDDKIGKWSHPLADDFIFNGLLYTPIFDEDADRNVDEETQKANFLNGKECSGHLLRIMCNIGEEESEKKLDVIILLEKEDWDKVVDEWENEDQPLTEFLFSTTNFFLSDEGLNDYQPGVDNFRDTEYCKKLNEIYNIDPSQIFYRITSDCHLIHKDGEFIGFES